ncbi:MAG: protease HtpX [Magnetococcales bacterium]|nr:protease HtpX [Magnetococcales bacterium]MBF0309604.1 protease HtpX [Magnetococcales bacterium]
MKRIVLFLLTNLAIMLVLGVVLNVVFQFTGMSQKNIPGLLVFAAIFGMGGAFISLAMSKPMAKWSTGAQVIDQPRDGTEAWLLGTVQRQAKAAGIGMPEVAIYEAGELNAFATGMNRNNALVAVSTGLLERMKRDEVEAVLGHEISHVANGDMVTMTLIQGVLNVFVILIARLLGGLIDNLLRSNDEEESSSGQGFVYGLVVFALEMVLGVLASLVVMAFSRYREFHADKGGAKLAGRESMIAALERLRRDQTGGQLPGEVAALGMNGARGGLSRLFMTHPPLEERIEALRRG